MAGAAPPYMDSLFQATVYQDGAKVGTAAQFNFASPLVVTWNDTTKRFDVAAPSSGVVTSAAVLAALASNTSAVNMNGVVIINGSTVTAPFRGKTTTGNGTATLVSVPIATDSGALSSTEISAFDTTAKLGWSWAALATPINTLSGTLSGSSPLAAAENNGLPIAPSLVSTWSAGNIVVVAHGPQASVIGTADNGSGKVRVHVSGTPLTAALTGESVTISGIVGTTEANGTHVATYVDSSHFDLTSVAYVNPWVSGGTVVEAVARLLTWSGETILRAIVP